MDARYRQRQEPCDRPGHEGMTTTSWGMVRHWCLGYHQSPVEKLLAALAMWEYLPPEQQLRWGWVLQQTSLDPKGGGGIHYTNK